MNVSRSIDVISPYANCPRPLDALQSADSFGAPESELTELDCGGIPWTKKAATNACAKPGTVGS